MCNMLVKLMWNEVLILKSFSTSTGLAVAVQVYWVSNLFSPDKEKNGKACIVTTHLLSKAIVLSWLFICLHFIQYLLTKDIYILRKKKHYFCQLFFIFSVCDPVVWNTVPVTD